MAALRVALEIAVPLPALAGGIVEKVALEEVRGTASMSASRYCTGKAVSCLPGSSSGTHDGARVGCLVHES